MSFDMTPQEACQSYHRLFTSIRLGVMKPDLPCARDGDPLTHIGSYADDAAAAVIEQLMAHAKTGFLRRELTMLCEMLPEEKPLEVKGEKT